MDRKAAIESAILRLTPDQFTRDGKPSVAAINDRIEQEGWQITAKERDALWVERVSEGKDAGAPAAEIEVEPTVIDQTVLDRMRDLPAAPEVHTHLPPYEQERLMLFDDPPEGTTKIKLTVAMSDPVPLYVHGVGAWSIRVGETVALPDEALDALRNSDCTFTQE